MATALLREISKDEHERARNRSRRMAETDRISDILTAEERGEIRGIALGETRGEERGKTREREKWQDVVADKDAKLAAMEAEIARLRTELEYKS